VTSSDAVDIDTVRSRQLKPTLCRLARSAMRSALHGVAYAVGSSAIGLLIWWLHSLWFPAG
jgi:hypothetical protein